MAGGLATLPHPQMQERPTALEQCPQGTRGLGQESVRAASHLPGPPPLGPVHFPWQLPPRTGHS